MKVRLWDDDQVYDARLTEDNPDRKFALCLKVFDRNGDTLHRLWNRSEIEQVVQCIVQDSNTEYGTLERRRWLPPYTRE